MRRRAVTAAVTALALAVTGVAWATSLTLTSTHLGASSVTTPVMFPDSVTTANVGSGVGKLEKNDTITFVWSQKVDQTTLCSGWPNSASTHTINMTWVVQNNTGTTGNDVLVAGATGVTCSSGLHIGSVDLGSPGYITTSNGTFATAATTVTVGTTTTSLVMKIPAAPTGGSVGTVASGSAAVWTPDATLADLSGHTCGANLAASSATVQF